MLNLGPCVLRASKPLGSVTALQHLGNTLVLGDVEPEWN